MEGNLSSINTIQGNGSYGFDLQGPMRVHNSRQSLAQHHQHNLQPRQQSSMINPTIHENFPLTIGNSQDLDPNISVADHNKMDWGKSASDEDEPSLMEDPGDSCSDQIKGKKASPWHRVKWTDAMIRLLITAVSYISEETASEQGSAARRKYATLQKKGKWKSVSNVMAERGHFVSPQQCEDKFNDLNKRYKRLNEMLGRGTSCEVVEKPALLDVMDHISEKAKDEVRKILSSKHLHYEEMCSYHNGNRLHLPPDPDLQHSLRLALRSRDDHDDRHPCDNDDIEQEGEFEDHGESEENQALPGNHIHRASYGLPGVTSKRAKQSQSDEDFSFGTTINSLDCNKTFNFRSENADSDANQVPADGRRINIVHEKQWMDNKNLQLEEQRLHIEMQMLELDKERFKWQRFCWKKDRELEMTRMEIEKMKFENERMALEIKQREMAIANSN